MKHVLQVLKFEYLSCVKSKSFIISTVIFMLLILLTTFIPGIVISMSSSKEDGKSDGGKKPVIAVMNNAYEENDTVISVFGKYYPNCDIKTDNKDVEDIKSKVDSSEYEFGIILDTPVKYTYITKNNALMNKSSEMVNTVVTDIFRTVSFEKLGVSADDAGKILNTPMTVNTITTGVDQTKNYWSTYILIMMLYMATVMYGQMVSQSVVSEKNTRAMEMLITCAKPSHLMFGKIIGSGLAGLTQLSLILLTAVGSVSAIGSNSIPKEILEFINFPIPILLYAVLFFILGYFIYAFLLGAFSSLASRSEDLNTLTSPIMIVYVAAFMIVIMSMGSDSLNGTLMIVCSYIPFTAPVAMFARVALVNVSFIEIILSILVQLISVYLLGMLASAIYRIGVLLYGNPPKPAEIVKLLKEQYKANKAIKEKK